MRKTSNRYREVNDWYVEPLWATELLIKSQRFSRYETIYDPCCGQGNILNAFYKMDEKDRPHIIKGTDLIDRGFINQDPRYPFYTSDFLQASPDKEMVGSIVFNPPYKYAQKCVDKAVQYGGPRLRVFALLPLRFLASQIRKEWFKSIGLEKLIILSKRPTMLPGDNQTKINRGTVDYGWFVFNKHSNYSNRIEWV